MKRGRTEGWLLLGVLCAGCTLFRPARGPLPTEAFVRRGPAEARGLIVMLPGFGDRPSDFENHAFLERLKRHAAGYDLLGVDAHFNYYRKGKVLRRLEQDVLGPARRAGYRDVWLLGVSMGGLGAVTYARAHPTHVSGVILFAPFWGRGKVVDAVAQAPSLCEWDAQRVAPPLSDEDQAYLENWRWLRRNVCDRSGPAVWLAYGEQDPPSPAGMQVVDRLPRERVISLPGGHGWEAWSRLLDAVSPNVFAAAAAKPKSMAQN